jgi:RNA polymerase sigma-70 factor (ECF subfamily)
MDFLEIYDLHHRPVKTFISKMVGDKWLADDLTQDTFIKVRKNLNGLKDDSKIMPWIFRIARNRCLDYFRTGAARNKGQELTNRFQKSIEPVVQMQLEQRQMSQCVQDKIYLLPETLRVALILSDTMEMTNQETADILNITVSNVKVRIHRARKALKVILEQECIFEHDERSVMVCEPKTDAPLGRSGC